jgi:hypothetical protein
VRYILAIFLPPIAVLLCGKPLLAFLLFVLQITVIAWPVATVIAWLIIHDHKANVRVRRAYA